MQKNKKGFRGKNSNREMNPGRRAGCRMAKSDYNCANQNDPASTRQRTDRRRRMNAVSEDNRFRKIGEN